MKDVLPKDEIAALLAGIDKDIFKSDRLEEIKKQGRALLEQAYACGWEDGNSGKEQGVEFTGEWRRMVSIV